MNTIKGIKLTERQKELVVELAKSEHFKLLRDVIIPQRQNEVAKMAINLTDENLKEVHRMQGELQGWKWLVGFLREAERFIQEDD